MRIFIRTFLLFIGFSLPVSAQGITDTTDILPDTLVLADTLTINDTLTVIDTLSLKEQVFVYDTAIYFPKYLYEHSYQINRDVFIRSDYLYTGNLLEPFQFNFIRHLGTPGQVNETFIYGVGFNGISFLQDGLLINERLNNLLDLNLVQSEDIETIEIIPSPRGFLYGPLNNPVAVNFIPRDFISMQPYSRIKYYQGPYGEAMVDGSFNALFSRKFQFSFDVTNKKFDSSYTNTAFSTWMAKVRARYYFTSNIYLSATYNYADKQTGNWQGIDADSILRSGIPLDDLLYEPDFAPVVNYFEKRDDQLHNTSLRFTSIQSENSRTELTLYHQFKESKIGLREFDNTSLGINLDQSIGIKPFNIYSALIYEQNKFENWYRGGNLIIPPGYNKWNKNFFAVSGAVSLDVLEDITPTVFIKYSGISRDMGDTQISDDSYIGYGADINYRPNEKFSYYIGYSEFEKELFKMYKTKTLEAGFTYKSGNHFADIRYFRRTNTGIWLFISGEDQFFVGNLSGVGLSGKTSYSFLLLEVTASKYFESKEHKPLKSLLTVPEYSFSAGLYFKGNLFEDNLNLKSGIKFNYTGKRIEPEGWMNGIKVDPLSRFDFILSGEIRKAAIIYFTIENILDKKYFVTPYYPMPGISLRFGLAWEFLN